MMMKKKKDGAAPPPRQAKQASRTRQPKQAPLPPLARKGTPNFSNDEYKSKTLPRSNSRGTEGTSLRWEVDSRIQLEKVATKIYAGEVDSREKKAGAMAARKKHNTTTSINNEGFGGGDIEYISDFMRSYSSKNLEGAEMRDPFQDLKRAKQLKKQLQKSQIDLGSGFGGGDRKWITDKQAGALKVERALASGEFAGRNPADDKKKAQALKKYLQRTTLELAHAEAVQPNDWRTDFQFSYADNLKGAELRDPFADIKRAKMLKAQLQRSQIDLGSGFGGGDRAWITDKQAGQLKVDKALMSGEFAGRNPADDKKKAQALKKYLQRTTLQLGFDRRYM
jgi:hypothetical protein